MDNMDEAMCALDNALRLGLAVAALTLSASAGAQGSIFSFVDEAGTLHLSNVDEDRPVQARLARAEEARRSATGSQWLPVAPSESRAERFRDVIAHAATQNRVDAALVRALVEVESAFDPRATSRRGAVGLMQLMPDTARRYGVVDPYDPTDNLQAGARYLGDLLRLFDQDLSLALAAYNAGEGAVLKHGRRIPPYPETIAYVPKVLAAYQRHRLPM
jgi:soluble lytic murein transglycosylase-like protein